METKEAKVELTDKMKSGTQLANEERIILQPFKEAVNSGGSGRFWGGVFRVNSRRYACCRESRRIRYDERRRSRRVRFWNSNDDRW